MNRATFSYRSQAKDRRALKIRLRDLTMSRVRFGYLRLTVMLKREGWKWARSWFTGCIGSLDCR